MMRTHYDRMKILWLLIIYLFFEELMFHHKIITAGPQSHSEQGRNDKGLSSQAAVPCLISQTYITINFYQSTSFYGHALRCRELIHLYLNYLGKQGLSDHI